MLATAAITTTLLAVLQSSSSRLASARSHHGLPLVPVDGGTVTIDVPSVPTTMNPHTVAGDNPTTEMVTSVVLPQVYETTPELTPELDTDVAQASVQSVNPLTVVYQINPRAVWSDGVPISSQDFVYAWRAQRGDGVDVTGQPDSVASSVGYKDIASVTGSNGGRTVTVVFRTPYADWASLFDDLMPAHVAVQAGWNTGFDTYNPSTLVSGGPWLISAWTPGTSMTLVRNPKWWGAKPNLDEIVLRAVPDTGAALDDVADGRAQVAEPAGFDAATLAQVSSHASVESFASIGTTMLQLQLNTRHNLLDQVAVREAIGHAIDRDALVTNLVGPLMRSTWEDNDFLAPNGDGAAYFDDAGSYTDVDLTATDQLLQQAGLVQNASHTWTWDGSPVVLHFVWAGDDPWSQLVGPAIAAQLVSAGFDVSTDPVPTSQLSATTLEQGRFDLALVPVQSTPYLSEMQRSFSTADGTSSASGSLDWSGYDSAHVDNLFTYASQQLNAAKADSVYQQIDQQLWNDLPALPLFAEPTLLATSPDLIGVQNSPGAALLWNSVTWAYVGPARSTASSTSSTISASSVSSASSAAGSGAAQHPG